MSNAEWKRRARRLRLSRDVDQHYYSVPTRWSPRTLARFQRRHGRGLHRSVGWRAMCAPTSAVCTPRCHRHMPRAHREHARGRDPGSSTGAPQSDEHLRGGRGICEEQAHSLSKAIERAWGCCPWRGSTARGGLEARALWREIQSPTRKMSTVSGPNSGLPDPRRGLAPHPMSGPASRSRICRRGEGPRRQPAQGTPC